MLCTTTTKPPLTRKLYVDFKKIFFKDPKNVTHLSIFRCFAPCQVDRLKHSRFQPFYLQRTRKPRRLPFFFNSCASSSFKKAAPKVLWEKVISKRSKELKSNPGSSPLVWRYVENLGDVIIYPVLVVARTVDKSSEDMRTLGQTPEQH